MPRYAAIDIGSKFHPHAGGGNRPQREFQELASARNVVRLGENVFREGRLSPVAMDLACQTLAGMAEEYRKLGRPGGARGRTTSALKTPPIGPSSWLAPRRSWERRSK